LHIGRVQFSFQTRTNFVSSSDIIPPRGLGEFFQYQEVALIRSYKVLGINEKLETEHGPKVPFIISSFALIVQLDPTLSVVRMNSDPLSRE
jgi:hypothetical protein